MKKILYIICVAAMILSSCTKDNDDLNSTMSSTKASFGNAVITRVDGEQWESADQIGIYMIDGAGAIDTYSNVPYSTSSSGDVASFSPSSSQVIYYKNSSESVAFWAYSPYDDELINNTAVVDISKNQSQPGLIDLLLAQTEAVYSKSNASVALEFKHILSKLTLNIEPGDGVTAEQLQASTTITASGFATLATFEFADQTLSVAERSDEPIELREARAGELYELILIPDSGVDLMATLKVDNAELPWALEDFDFESGMEYTYTLTVDKDGITVSSSSINGWNYGESDNLTASKHPFSGGSGSENDPYLLSKVGDLENLAILVNDGERFEKTYFKLTTDIDLEGSEDNTWTPIGYYEYDGINYGPLFSGILDGNNKSITGLYITDGEMESVGFIGALGSDGVVKNLTIYGDIDVEDVTTTYRYGGIIAFAKSNYIIDNCVNYVNINLNTSTYYNSCVGGIVGYARGAGIISNCTNYGKLYYPTKGNTGGIVSYTPGLIINCSNHGDIDGDSIGGIVSNLYKCSVSEDASYSYTNSVINCTNTGDLTANSYIGGVAGEAYGQLNNNYTIGKIIGGTYDYTAGVLGYSKSTEGSSNDNGYIYFPTLISNCYYDREVNDIFPIGTAWADTIEEQGYPEDYGREEYYNSNGHKTKYMRSADLAAILNHTAAVYNQTSIYSACAWEYDAVNSCSVLNLDKEPEMYKYSSGSGTEASPYKISTRSDMVIFAGVVNSGTSYDGVYFEITANIDLEGDASDPWMPIGSEDCPFGGRINGNGKAITGLYIDSIYENQGLFGYTSAGSYVKNINVSGSINATNNNVGGVAGTAKGEIINCASNVSITATATNVGGVAGQAISTQVANSYSLAAISGTATNVGGVVGTSDATRISNCFATSAISGSANVGGVAGSSSYIISYCYFNSDNFAGEIVASNSHYAYSSEGKSSSEMCSEEFELMLEQRAFDYNQETPLVDACGWVYNGGSSYPTLAVGVAPDSHSQESGTITNPYTISSVEDLKQLSEDSCNGLVQESMHYVLTKDIDLKGSASDPWTPIGTSENCFWGIFNGGGYTISGIYIDSSEDYQGLFGYLGNGGSITDLTVEGELRAAGSYIGGVVGFLGGYSYVTGCTNRVAITTTSGGSLYTGGVVGFSYGMVSYCTNEADISGQGAITAGVVGLSYPYDSSDDYAIERCYISHCHNSGNISSTSTIVGGIAGHLSLTPISYCSNSGDIHSDSSMAAGIFAYSGTFYDVHNCFNTGDIYAGSGTASGIATGDSGLFSNFINCYNTGNVSSPSRQVAGLVVFAGSITNCYNTGAISADDTYYYNGSLVGFVGYSEDRTERFIYNSYFLEGTYVMGCGYDYGETAESSLPESATIYTDEQMKQSSFVEALNAGQSPAVWKADDAANPINGGYPILVWQ